MTSLRQSPEWAGFLTKLGWKAEKLGSDQPLLEGMYQTGQYQSIRPSPEPNGSGTVRPEGSSFATNRLVHGFALPEGASFAYIRKLSLIGSIIKVPEAGWPLNLAKLDQIARKNRALFVKLEFHTDQNAPEAKKLLAKLSSLGYSADNWVLSPSKTFVLDISQPEDELLKNLEKDTRYSLNLAKRNGVKVVESDNIDEFYELYKQTSKRKRFWIGSKEEIKRLFEAFRASRKAQLLVARANNGQLLAACLILGHERTAFYHIAASSETNKKQMAPYLLIWEAIAWAKKKDYLWFDLGGIEDKRYRDTRRWGGFTHFKRGFRGQEVTYLGSYTKHYNPVIRLIFRIFNFF